jgi:NADH dehydrogenase
MPATTPQRPRILILGGGYGGLTAAARLTDCAGHADITLVDAKTQFSERIRLHQVLAGQSLPRWSYQDFLQPRNIRFLQARVTALLPTQNRVLLSVAENHQQELEYDYLIYACGSYNAADSVPGAAQYAHFLNSPGQVAALGNRLQQQSAKVLLVGGGLTSLETATELAESMPHLEIHLAWSQPLPTNGEAGSYTSAAADYLYQRLQTLGISLHEGSRVTGIQENMALRGHDMALPFDTCIWASGFQVAALASASGISVNHLGQILVDHHLRSHSHPNILAIGDAAAASTAESGICRMSCASALPMATAAARSLRAMLQNQPLPGFRFNYLFRNISLGRRDGLIQFVDSADRPRHTIWTGQRAAHWKDYICRSTLTTIGLNPAEKLPCLPPLRMLPQLMRAAKQYA